MPGKKQSDADRDAMSGLVGVRRDEVVVADAVKLKKPGDDEHRHTCHRCGEGICRSPNQDVDAGQCRGENREITNNKGQQRDAEQAHPQRVDIR
jgi:hypothetical protein